MSKSRTRLRVSGSLGLVLVFGLACAPAAPSRPPTATASTPKKPHPTSNAALPAPPIRRVILVTIDGMMPDTYQYPDELGLSVPTLRWMKEHGAASAGVRSVFPTLTYPSHTSIATGVNPNHHRIVANRSFDPMETDQEGWRWYAEDIAAPTLWQLAESRGLPTALIYWPVTVGAKVHWRVPEFWRAGNDQDLKLQRAVSTPGLLEAVAAKHPDFWTRFTPPAIHDDALVDIAEHLLSVEKPRLLMMHLVQVDTEQHHHGIGSPEAKNAIEADDAQVARILRAIEVNGMAKETALVVASDHGFRSASRAVRPCALLTEAGLVRLKGDKIADYDATVQAHAGEAYVYLKSPTDTAVRERVRELFELRIKDPTSGIARLYDTKELLELGGDATAAFALGAAPGYQFAPGCRGTYRIESNGYVATHGFDPRDPDMRASLLIVGPSIPHGTIEDARLIDIAPTIAGWLGIPFPDVEGKALRIFHSR
ncbi:MAG: ectonucleotide pyrophosphatase/phosphodiesterase [Polyangiaceae bacterium]